MILCKKTLEHLREIINEKTEYRSGPKLIQFFNNLGFSDSYGQGFPSRWIFTDSRLESINGTARLDECIKAVFAPVNFVGRMQELDELLKEFNQYLTFDKWKVIRNNAEITFQRLDKVEIEPDPVKQSENEFLQREFSNLAIKAMPIESTVCKILEERVREIEKCFTAGSYLAAILLAGSTLEGLLLGMAIQYPRQFNTAKAAPKVDTRVKSFQDWTLSNFIDVAKEIGLVEHDTHRFSHALRDFRNYIHPYHQMASGFSPREHTAKISLQVLKAAIQEIGESIPKYSA